MCEGQGLLEDFRVELVREAEEGVRGEGENLHAGGILS